MFDFIKQEEKVHACSFILFTFIIFNSLQPFAFQDSLQTTNQLLEVKIYYETLCPFSILFFRRNLYDAMISKNFIEYTNLKLVPYGKTKVFLDPDTNQEYFTCQHGIMECTLNSLHACIVENHNQMEQLLLIDCLMARFSLEMCSKELNVNITASLRCKMERSVVEILENYGEQTKAINLTEVPSLAIDGIFNKEAQNNLRSNFSAVFCLTYKEKYNITLRNCTEL